MTTSLRVAGEAAAMLVEAGGGSSAMSWEAAGVSILQRIQLYSLMIYSEKPRGLAPSCLSWREDNLRPASRPSLSLHPHRRSARFCSVPKYAHRFVAEQPSLVTRRQLLTPRSFSLSLSVACRYSLRTSTRFGRPRRLQGYIPALSLLPSLLCYSPS